MGVVARVMRDASGEKVEGLKGMRSCRGCRGWNSGTGSEILLQRSVPALNPLFLRGGGSLEQWNRNLRYKMEKEERREERGATAYTGWERAVPVPPFQRPPIAL